jgi:hypothetical protein
MRLFLSATILFSLAMAAQQAAPPTAQTPVPANAPATPQTPIEIKLESPAGNAPVGSDIKVLVDITDTSQNRIFLPFIVGRLGLDLFVKFDVRDQDGKPVAETPERIKMRHAPLHPYRQRPLKPGDSVNAEIILNRDYDLSKPGKYSVQAVATDPATKTTATSNTLSVTVLPPNDQPPPK